jgi:hypothetical protein
MVNTFPQLSNIDSTTRGVIESRAGKNVTASKLIPWMRILSAVGKGLVIESIPKNDSFSQRYGNSSRAGRVGIDFSGKDYFEDESVRGYRPSPTISSLSVENGAQGLSRKTTFTIVCYTIGQAEIITKHFLEPGYTVLVEWGWNSPKSANQKCGLNKCDIADYNNIKTILKKRKDSDGTYDAVLGFITGGGMDYGDGETFNVNIELTSLGEIPAYLQPHKGFNKTTSSGNKVNTGDKFYGYQINAARTGNQGKKDIGKGLFMQMYNDLPNHKQIAEIKVLGDNPRWTDPANFINMDEKIRETLRDDFDVGMFKTKVRVQTEKGEAKIELPEGIDLVTNQRFIRMDLAFEILNTVQDGTLIPVVDGDCGKKVMMNNRISIDDTICRAHKHMFSTDVNKLYIPNKNLPDFGLVDALTSTEIQSTFIKFLGSGNNQYIEKTVDGHPKTDKDYKYFPRTTSFTFNDLNSFIPEVMPYKEFQPHTWGWLTDLYLNFDFFKEVIDRKGLLIKDIVLEILNGVSSAVNMYWEFQIVDRCSKGVSENISEPRQSAAEGTLELQIKEIGTGGVPTKSIQTIFQSRGLKTPFIQSSLKMDIPGAMKNMIVGQRNAASQGNAEARDIIMDNAKDGLFSNEIDPVLQAINSMAKNAEEAKKNPKKKEEQKYDKDIEKENKKKNLELFTQTAGIFPKIQDSQGNIDAVLNWFDFIDTNKSTLNDLLIVGTYNDPSLLKMIQQIDDCIFTGGSYKGVLNNSIILPIKFDFTIHGVSGLKVGDVFKIDDLPKKYRTKIFQIMQINHSLDDNGWFTQVESQIRNTDGI